MTKACQESCRCHTILQFSYMATTTNNPLCCLWYVSEPLAERYYPLWLSKECSKSILVQKHIFVKPQDIILTVYCPGFCHAGSMHHARMFLTSNDSHYLISVIISHLMYPSAQIHSSAQFGTSSCTYLQKLTNKAHRS